MAELTDEQRAQVQRLLRLHYVKGIADSARHVAEAFGTLGFSASVAERALEDLLKWVEEQTDEIEAEVDGEDKSD